MVSFTGQVILSDGKTYNLTGDATEVTGGGGGGSGGTPITGGAKIGNATAGGGLSAAFDGNASKAAGSCARSQGFNPGWIGAYWPGAAKTISRVKLTGPNNARISGGVSNVTGTLKIYGKATGTVTSPSDSALVLLYQQTFTEAAWPQVLDTDILGGWVVTTGSYESIIAVGSFPSGIADWNIAQQEWWS